jgi:hypothetical protein
VAIKVTFGAAKRSRQQQSTPEQHPAAAAADMDR